jgi:GDPmannose 4,6-dehydratase
MEGDLLDLGSLITCVKNAKPDYVFHLAAQSFPMASFTSPGITFSTNINGTYNLLEAIRISNLNPAIHVCSSSEVYGRVSADQLPIDENCRFHPASPYAISKVGTDLIGRFYNEAYGMRTAVTRMFTHTGPRRGDVFAESSFAKQIVLAEHGIIAPEIKVGNLNSLRTFADVRDAVRAYHTLLTCNFIPGSDYNIGGNFTATIGDMLNYLISLSTCKHLEVKVDASRVRPIDADLQVPDCSKFKNHTGWEPEIKYEKTMEDLLNYWRQQVASGRGFSVR